MPATNADDLHCIDHRLPSDLLTSPRWVGTLRTGAVGLEIGELGVCLVSEYELFMWGFPHLRISAPLLSCSAGVHGSRPGAQFSEFGLERATVLRLLVFSDLWSEVCTGRTGGSRLADVHFWRKCTQAGIGRNYGWATGGISRV